MDPIDTSSATLLLPADDATTLKVEAVMRADHSQDYPSPPTSVSKDSSYSAHSIIKSNQPYSPASQADTNEESKGQDITMQLDESSVEAPPSPPTSAHSSEASMSPIRPAYFYAQGTEKVSSKVLTPDEAPGVPVFEPTWEDFKDFYTFCQRIDEWGMKCGIVKIIPPREWVESLPRLDGRHPIDSGNLSASGSRYTADNPLSQVRIKNSIEQIFTPAGPGSWRQSNVVHPARVVNPKQWADVCASVGQKGPEMARMKENAKRNEDEGAEEDGVRTRSGRGFRAAKAEPALVNEPSRTAPKRKRSEEAEDSTENAVATSSAAPESEPVATTDEMPALEDGETSKAQKLKYADRTSQQEWDNFDYIRGWCQEAGEGTQPDDYSPTVCRAIESEYWRGLNFGKPPMYGADLKGTLFTPATQHWNVGCLDNILTRLRLRRKLPGVTTPYLYFGMWRATFAWHVEDMDLYSINYIHFGAPKQWYAIRQCDRQRFELAMAGTFPGDSSRCKHFMRHKSYLASPAFLASAGIKPIRLVQKAQEFVITYPYGYHSGFNLGFNCAESVNFALESWLDIGRKAGYCDCANDSVKMDVDAMLEESREMEEMDRKKEEREKRKEVEDKMALSELEKLEARRAKERERRRLKKERDALMPGGGESAAPPIKKVKKNGLPCVFCPSASEEDLVMVPWPESNNTDEVKKPARYAHRLCACFVPETWVENNPDWSEENNLEPKEIVMGFQGIERARWSLKCQNCTDPNMAKKGAKVQCTYGKCARTTHVSCALYLASGWMIDMLPNAAADVLEGKSKKCDATATMDDSADPTIEGDAVEEDEAAVRPVLLCKSHNPKEKEKEAQRRMKILRRCVAGLQIGQAILVRTGSGVWETVLKEIRWPEDNGVEGEVIADEDQVLKWSRVLFDADTTKKAEDEQWKQDEEEATMMAEEAVDEVEEPEAVTKLDDNVIMQFKSEEAAKKAQEKAKKEQEKIAQQEAKLAARLAKEEEKKAKAEKKEAKRLEREEKAVAQQKKRAEREAIVAAKAARAAELAAIKQSVLAGSNQTSALSASQMNPHYPSHPQQHTPNQIVKRVDEYEHIRNWKPQGPTHPKVGVLNQHLNNNANREQIQSPMDRWAVHQASTSYPPHLATYQKGIYDRAPPHPAYPVPNHYSSQDLYRGMQPVTNLNFQQHQQQRSMYPSQHQVGFPPRQQLDHPSYASHHLPPQANGYHTHVQTAPWERTAQHADANTDTRGLNENQHN